MYPPTQQDGGVWINAERLGDQEIQRLAIGLGGPIPPGRYWYDKLSGLWGILSQPAQGQIAAGLTMGGALAPDASAGHTGVFVNGRQLPAAELAPLQALLGHVPQGDYHLDALGSLGPEGGPPRVNLRQLMQRQAAAAYSPNPGWPQPMGLAPQAPASPWGHSAQNPYYAHQLPPNQGWPGG